ncbi:MAG: AMP-binding protein [Oscillochloridaceae bacterium umkhey_bin13]
MDQIAPGDCTLYASPISHGAGMYNFAHVLRAARQIVPTSGGFDPAEILSLSRTHPGMALFAAPTMVRRLVEYVQAAQPELAGLKTIVYGGGPMYLADIREALAVLGDRLVQIYGQGESPMTITVLSRQHLQDASQPRHNERIASVGVAQAAVEVRITGSDGQPLPAEALDEIEVRGDTVMLGYWRNPAATAATLVGGWLRTGDVGSLDDDGFLTLRDRSKDVIISGGSNIYPREVEEVLLRHPAVREVAVIGKPDPEWGEAVIAFVTCHTGMSVAPAELDALCLAQIARFKRPRAYRFVDDLPKNNYGKVLKTVLWGW